MAAANSLLVAAFLDLVTWHRNTNNFVTVSPLQKRFDS